MELSIPSSRPFFAIVSTLEGVAVAVDVQTGAIMWRAGTGGPLVSSHGNAAGNVGRNIVPGIDGSLFSVQKEERQAILQRFPASVFDVVQTSTIVQDRNSGASTILVGNKHSKVVALDPLTGSEISSAKEDPSLSHQIPTTSHKTQTLSHCFLRRAIDQTKGWSIAKSALP